MSANITISGELIADPELRETPGGIVVTKLRLAQTHRRFDRNTGVWVDVATSHYTVNCWRQLGLRVAADLKNGDPVIVVGRQQVKRWQRRDGSWDSDVDIEANLVGVDVRRVVVHVQRSDPRALPVQPTAEVEPLHAELTTAVEPAA